MRGIWNKCFLISWERAAEAKKLFCRFSDKWRCFHYQRYKCFLLSPFFLASYGNVVLGYGNGKKNGQRKFMTFCYPFAFENKNESNLDMKNLKIIFFFSSKIGNEKFLLSQTIFINFALIQPLFSRISSSTPSSSRKQASTTQIM